MTDKEKYDQAHQKKMDEMNESSSLSDMPEHFVKGVFGLPGRFIHDFTQSDVESKAEQDAINGDYEPPEED